MMVKGTYMGMDVLGYFIETPNKTLSLNSNDEYEATKKELLSAGLRIKSDEYWFSDSSFHARFVCRY